MLTFDGLHLEDENRSSTVRVTYFSAVVGLLAKVRHHTSEERGDAFRVILAEFP
jgi:glucuronate isomerase